MMLTDVEYKNKKAMERVLKKRNQWEYYEDGLSEDMEWCLDAMGISIDEFKALPEGEYDDDDRWQIIDNVRFVPITDRVHMQVCIINRNSKYGLYILDTCKFFGGPGTYINPEEEAFPYDEVFISNCIDGVCYAAVKKANKWGIVKIADIDYANSSEHFDSSYRLTKRRIFVPCEYDTLESAQTKILNWQDCKHEIKPLFM